MVIEVDGLPVCHGTHLAVDDVGFTVQQKLRADRTHRSPSLVDRTPCRVLHRAMTPGRLDDAGRDRQVATVSMAMPEPREICSGRIRSHIADPHAHDRRGGDDMLAKHPIDVMLTATDLGAAKRFYRDRVGLDVLIESDDFLTFGCGGDSRLVVTRTSTPSGEQQTKASWRVADVVAEVAELRARGVDVVEYDEPYLKTVDGVADVGFALSAWFVDPGGNSIGLLQFKDKGSG
jgi:hypothetical protein